VAGTYTSTKTVTISDSTTGVTIYYTTDGTQPTTSSTVYSSPITIPVSTTETVNAIAASSSHSSSVVGSAGYTVNKATPLITWLPTPSSFTYGSALPPIPVGYIDKLPGNGAQLGGSGVAVDKFNNIYSASSNTILMLAAVTGNGYNAGNVYTVAGGGSGCTGETDTFGDGCPAADGILSGATGVAVDLSGNIYIADSQNYLIRMVAGPTNSNYTPGYIYTVAGYAVNGTGICGMTGVEYFGCVYSSGNGPATSIALDGLYNLAVDTSGNVYFAEPVNCRIRMIAASTTGNYTQGYVYTVSPSAAGLNYPEGVVVDASNDIYIADSGDSVIRMIAGATRNNYTQGNIYTVAGNYTAGYSGDGGAATNAQLNYPTGLAVDTSGNLYIADLYNNAIREVAASNGVVSSSSIITTVAGNGSLNYTGVYNEPATSIPLGGHAGSVAVDGYGNIYIDGGAYAVAASNLTLVASQLDATASDPNTSANVPGTFAYTPPLGSTLTIGQQTISTTFTPKDTTDYTTATSHTSLTVSQATSTLTITPIPNQTYGVSPFTVSATSVAPGTIGFSVGSGSPATISGPTSSTITITGAGTVTLNATLYPATDDYTTATASTSFTVSPATPTLTINPIPAQIYTANPLTTFAVSATSASSGAITYSVASGPATISGSTVTITGVGTVTLNASQAATTDYTAATAAPVTVAVNQATPLITWATPAPVAVNTYLSVTQLNASASVAGVLSYSPVSGTQLTTAGLQPLTATFTPSNSTLYTTASATVYLIVNAAGTKYDTGSVSLTVNGGAVSTASYGAGSTPSSIAETLAAAASSTQVTVTAVDDTLTIATKPAYAGSDFSFSIQNAGYDSADFSYPSFPSSTISGTLTGGAGTSSPGQTTPVYSYCVPGPSNPNCTSPTNDYDPVGNLLGYTDFVMGTWNFSYDTLNRLITGTPAAGNQSNNGQNLCWAYDDFGNRTAQDAQSAACPSAPAATASYNANNQLTWTSVNAAGSNFTYDAAGDATNDNANQYLYDGEGRICAVKNLTVGVMTGYIYDAEGTRVSKGTLTYFSCDMNPANSDFNGFQPTNDYILGPSGEQVTEMGVGGTTDGSTTSSLVWQHTNIWVGGTLLGTYDGGAGTGNADTTYGLHFYFNDPLGTRRVQTDYAGVVEQTCQSLPYGDGLSCTGSTITPTEHHFTAKERDAESGLDDFGARYYASSLGRFMSPDWSVKVEPVPYAKLGDPQSLNLYAYMMNNPLGGVDADGHDGEGGGGVEGWLRGNGNNEMADVLFGTQADSQEMASAAPDAVVEIQESNTASPAEKHISKRDRAYLDKYYKAVVAMAKAFGLDPALLLGLGGHESTYATSPRYKRTGDAFGMSGGQPGDIMHFKSPDKNASKWFGLYGDRIRGVGSNVEQFLNGLELEDANGNQLTTKPDRNGNTQNLCCMYNSQQIPPTDWKDAVRRNITEIQGDLSVYTPQ